METHNNTGDYNVGSWNTGDRNVGDCNTGGYNVGDWNVGDCNVGDENVGSWNVGDEISGYFNTLTPDTVTVFNNTKVKRMAFLRAVPGWLSRVSPITLTRWSDATDSQKAAFPEGETTGWIVEKVSMSEAYARAWAESDRDADAVRAMPGFDHDVWFEITGINLNPPVAEVPAVPETVVVDGHTYRLEQQPPECSTPFMPRKEKRMTNKEVIDMGGGVKVIHTYGGVGNGGSEEWLLNGVPHRVDGPAAQCDGGVSNGGSEEWYLNGKFHRVDGPAFQYRGGVERGGHEYWYLNGVLHRVDGPAIQYRGGVENGGRERWYRNGKPHREDGPAVQSRGGVENGGHEEWYRNGKPHRVDGPAIQYRGGVERGGHEEWFVNGELHREDGPAIQYRGGVARGGTEQYWLHGERQPAPEGSKS